MDRTELGEQNSGVKGGDLPGFLAGLQPGQFHQFLQHGVQSLHSLPQEGRRFQALGLGHGRIAEQRGGEVYADDIIFQIVDRLVEERGAVLFDLVEAGKGTAKVADMTGGLSLLHAFVLSGAFADGVVDEGHDLAVCLGQGFRFDLRIFFREAAQLIIEAELEMAAFIDEFLQPVTLLPAVEAVLHPLILLVCVGSSGRGTARARAQAKLKRIQHFRDVVEELPESQGTAGGLTGVGPVSLAPSLQDSVAPGGKVVTEGGELLALGHGHRPTV